VYRSGRIWKNDDMLKEKSIRWDCESIVIWFYRNQHKYNRDPDYTGFKILKKCSEDTGVPRTTVYYLIDAYLKYKKGEFESWLLDKFANGIGYRVRWLGHENGYIWVYKNTDEDLFPVNNINTENILDEDQGVFDCLDESEY